MRSASTAVSGSPVSRYCLARAGPDRERPDGGAAVAGDDADPHVRIADRRRVGHEDHVAEERDRRAEPHGVPVQRRDDRHLDVEQIPDELLGVAAQRLHAPGRAQLGEPGEVAAGGERAAAAGQEHAARVGFPPEPREERGEIVVQRVVDGVQRARRVRDRDAQHVAAALERPGS